MPPPTPCANCRFYRVAFLCAAGLLALLWWLGWNRNRPRRSGRGERL